MNWQKECCILQGKNDDDLKAGFTEVEYTQGSKQQEEVVPLGGPDKGDLL